jgi:hypothetical protein
MRFLSAKEHDRHLHVNFIPALGKIHTNHQKWITDNPVKSHWTYQTALQTEQRRRTIESCARNGKGDYWPRSRRTEALRNGN